MFDIIHTCGNVRCIACGLCGGEPGNQVHWEISSIILREDLLDAYPVAVPDMVGV